MLKIGIVRWRGKCPRHPRFDPYIDGLGAIKGGCPKCAALWEIFEHHQKIVSLMRSFAPPPVKRPPKPREDRQTNLFDEPAT